MEHVWRYGVRKAGVGGMGTCGFCVSATWWDTSMENWPISLLEQHCRTGGPLLTEETEVQALHKLCSYSTWFCKSLSFRKAILGQLPGFGLRGRVPVPDLCVRWHVLLKALVSKGIGEGHV